MSIRVYAFLSVLAMLPLASCSCGEEAAGGSGDTGGEQSVDGSTSDLDGALAETDGATSDLDGALADLDGALPGGDAGPGGSDGSSSTDGGNPLEQELEDFCRGQGSVVTLGPGAGGGTLCAGEVAEETFQFALCACESVSAQSTLELDAFDSRLGVYGATLAGGRVNRDDDGHLGVNGELDMDGKLSVRGSAFIGGGGISVGSQSRVTINLYANGDAVQNMSASAIGRNAYINGNVVGRFEIGGDLVLPAGAMLSTQTQSEVQGRVIRRAVTANPPCPCEANQILDVGAITDFGRTHNDNGIRRVLTSTTYQNGGPTSIRLPCGRYYLTRIQQPGGLQIIAEGRTVLFVDGDMSIGGAFDLRLEPGAEVDLFVKGALSVGASARFGDATRPSMVRTYVGGGGTITLSASAIFGGNLYAPNASVVFSASADLYGALFARSASFSGSANVHFDSAIRAAGDVCERPPMGTDGGVSDGSVADAGTADASVSGMDATAGGMDANQSFPDAAADAGMGPMGCTGCNQCGNLACLIPEGATEGVCGACSSDLDCCAPFACVAGVCTLNL